MAEPSYKDLSPRIGEMLAEIKLIGRLQAGQGPLHQPSAIENWLGLGSAAFFDIERLKTFRHQHGHLHLGTMNWPNRREAFVDPRFSPDLEWSDRRSLFDEHPGFARKVKDKIDSVKGHAFLLRQYWRLRSKIPADVWSSISDTSVGGPFGLRLHGGRFLTEPAIRHAYYLGQLATLIPLRVLESAVVLEIGGGYGSLTQLIKRRFPSTRFVLVDLPERLALQAYYLASCFPQAEMKVVDGTLETEIRIRDNSADFILIPTWQVERLQAGSIDVVINTHSMQEMTLQQVRYYVELIERVCANYFYCVNRKEKVIGDETIPHPAELLSNNWEAVYQGNDPYSARVLESLHQRRRVD